MIRLEERTRLYFSIIRFVDTNKLPLHCASIIHIHSLVSIRYIPTLRSELQCILKCYLCTVPDAQEIPHPFELRDLIYDYLRIILHQTGRIHSVQVLRPIRPLL